MLILSHVIILHTVKHFKTQGLDLYTPYVAIDFHSTDAVESQKNLDIYQNNYHHLTRNNLTVIKVSVLSFFKK